MGKHNGTPDAEPMEHDIHDNDDLGILEELKRIASNDPAKKKKKNSKKLKSKCGSFPVTRKEKEKKTKTKSKSLRIVRGTTPPPSDEPNIIIQPSKKKRERSKSVQISSHDDLRRVRDGTDDLSSSGDPLKDEEEAYADDEGHHPPPLQLPTKKKTSKSPTTKPKTPRPGSSSLSFSAIIPSSPRKRRPLQDLGDAFQKEGEKERPKEKQKEKEREKEQEKERESDSSEPEPYRLTSEILSRHTAHADLLQSCPVTPTRPSSVTSMRESDSESDLLSGYSSDVKQKLRTKFWADAIEDTRQDKGVSGQPPCTNLNIVNRLFGQFFADKANIFAGFLAFVLVTPYTIITPMSLYYQLYLNEIFHTTFISRSAHFLLMPAITWVQLTMAAHFEWRLSSTPVEATPTGIINGREIDLFAVNGAFYLACLFLFWWITWGFVTKTYCFGFFVIPHLFVLYVTANLFHYMTCYPPEIATWYAPAPFWANPFVIGFVLAFLQAASHYQEPLPPRVNLTPHWQPLNQWIESYSKEAGAWKTFSLIAFQFMTGTVNEFCAGPRLFPLLVLKQMHMLGYKREQWKHLVRLVKWARKHNDPALDYIGRGGALPADEQRVPETPEEAKEELASLRGKEDPASKLRRSFLVQLLAKARLNQLALRPFSRDRKKGKFPEVAPQDENSDDQSDSSESEGAPDNKPAIPAGDKDFAKMLHLVRKDVRSIEKHRKYLRQSSAAAFIAARSPLAVRKTNN